MGEMLDSKRTGNSASGYDVNEDGSVTKIGNVPQEPQRCPVCNSENPGIARYCHVCGKKLSNKTSDKKIYNINTKTVSNTNKDSIMSISVVVAIIGLAIALGAWNLIEYILGVAVIGVFYVVCLVISKIYHKLFD